MFPPAPGFVLAAVSPQPFGTADFILRGLLFFLVLLFVLSAPYVVALVQLRRGREGFAAGLALGLSVFVVFVSLPVSIVSLLLSGFAPSRELYVFLGLWLLFN